MKILGRIPRKFLEKLREDSRRTIGGIPEEFLGDFRETPGGML